MMLSLLAATASEFIGLVRQVRWSFLLFLLLVWYPNLCLPPGHHGESICFRSSPAFARSSCLKFARGCFSDYYDKVYTRNLAPKSFFHLTLAMLTPWLLDWIDFAAIRHHLQSTCEDFRVREPALLRCDPMSIRMPLRSPRWRLHRRHHLRQNSSSHRPRFRQPFR
jgi:hypothetical protein